MGVTFDGWQAETVLFVFERTPPRPRRKLALSAPSTPHVIGTRVASTSCSTSTALCSPQPRRCPRLPLLDLLRASAHCALWLAQAIQILRERLEFLGPVPLLRVHPDITIPAFSISAWVEQVSAGAKISRRSIVRQPLADHNELSCWGWFYPGCRPHCRD